MGRVMTNGLYVPRAEQLSREALVEIANGIQGLLWRPDGEWDLRGWRSSMALALTGIENCLTAWGMRPRRATAAEVLGEVRSILMCQIDRHEHGDDPESEILVAAVGMIDSLGLEE